MTLDPLRQKIVLCSNHFNDVWEFDLATQLWNDVTPAAAGPSARSKFVMVFDLLNVQVVVFGGTSATSASAPCDNLLYGWNGTSWSVLDSGTGPSPRVDAMMAANVFGGGDLLLYGGRQGSLETWRWLGTGVGGTWSLVPTATLPGATGLNGARMVYDEIRERYVMHCGSYPPTIDRPAIG